VAVSVTYSFLTAVASYLFVLGYSEFIPADAVGQLLLPNLLYQLDYKKPYWMRNYFLFYPGERF